MIDQFSKKLFLQRSRPRLHLFLQRSRPRLHYMKMQTKPTRIHLAE